MDDRGKPDLVARTRAFALSVIRFYSKLPRETVPQVLGRQLLRSGTSVGAQYREGQRAKSMADFISKCKGALQELEESSYWLELMEESGQGGSMDRSYLRSEANQLVSIFVSLVKTAKETRAGR